jgi:lysozyme
MSTTIGVDVSHHNVDDRGSAIDWGSVLSAGYTFAFVKCSDGATYQDPEFGNNVRGARNAGLAVGAYHFLRPGSDAAAQAQNFLSHISAIGGMSMLSFGIAVDVEDPDDAPGSWNPLDQDTRKQKVLNWIAAVQEQVQITPYIYCIPNWFAGNIGSDAEFGQYPLWMAAPSGQPSLDGTSWQDYAIWQYNQHGSVVGIGNKSVDLDQMKPQP